MNEPRLFDALAEKIPRKISFTVYGAPIGKGSGRAVSIPGRGARIFTDTKTRKYMDHVRQTAVDAMAQVEGELLEGPLRLAVRFFLSRPQRLNNKRGRPMPACWAPTRPDASNILKAIEDALNTVCFGDDRQIVHVEMEKRYAAGPGGDERPRVEIGIEEIDR